MAQQLSTELIYVILSSVTQFTAGEPKSKCSSCNHSSKEYLKDLSKYNKYDFTNMNDIFIESMIVKNPEKLSV